MRITNEIDLSKLYDYGFSVITDEYKKANGISEDNVLYNYDGYYAYSIGHARRGQFYYLLVAPISRVLSVIATEPDGTGSDIELPHVLLTLIRDGLVAE